MAEPDNNQDLSEAGESKGCSHIFRVLLALGGVALESAALLAYLQQSNLNPASAVQLGILGLACLGTAVVLPRFFSSNQPANDVQKGYKSTLPPLNDQLRK
ncbi:MAG: hypothetical protein WCJ58_08155 [bacterium]